MECEELEPYTRMKKFLYPIGQWFADFFFVYDKKSFITLAL